MNQPLSSKEKAKIMAETAQHLIDMIQRRLSNRINALNALQASPMDMVPDEVKKMREVEMANIRAVMQEQTDLIEIIRLIFPNVTPATTNDNAKK